MKDKLLIISGQETFLVRGLEMKLQEMDVETIYCEPKINPIKEKMEGTNAIIIYMDKNVEDYAEAFVFLKDLCHERDEKVILIGSKEEYDIVSEYVSATNIEAFFDRPLNMDKFLDSMEGFLSKERVREKRKSILIVDDDASYMSMIYDWLKDTYKVAMANSGMQAITHLAKGKVDLILLDYEMPITSGPQVLEMIRAEAGTSDIPVMFLTGKNDKESIMKVLSLKPVDYLLKTIDEKSLKEKLNNYFMINS